jgi:mannose-1-phosphate guanylyltransferase/mannose-6-phosphate isomerase
MAEDKRIVPVILSGGAGTRLWPRPSATGPRRFLAVAGERGRLQETASIEAPLVPAAQR